MKKVFGFFLFFSSALLLGQGQSSSARLAATSTNAQVSERLAADTPKTTVLGNAFIAPKDWSIRIKGPATILEAPEGDSWVALIDVQAKGPDEALAAAWQAYKPDAKWPLKVSNDLPDRDGWSRRRAYEYLTSPNEKRRVNAVVFYSGSSWTVAIEDLADAVAGKRGAQVALIFGRLLPKGYTRESFAGKKANLLDQARIAELGRFVEQGQKTVGVPGVAVGLVQNGKVVFADGFGVKDLGGTQKPDGDTLFMIASNTKAMTTLLLAKLVDEHRITWETPVTTLFPSFRLGDAETTRSVLVKHLICACTGMPRQDLEWIFDYGKMTPRVRLPFSALCNPPLSSVNSSSIRILWRLPLDTPPLMSYIPTWNWARLTTAPCNRMCSIQLT
jgi:Beta-lactamase